MSSVLPTNTWSPPQNGSGDAPDVGRLAHSIDSSNVNASLLQFGFSALSDLAHRNITMATVSSASSDSPYLLVTDEGVYGNHGYWDEGKGGEGGDTVISNIILPIVCLCGIAGIVLTIIVLSQKHMSTSTNCYLVALSSADLAFLVLLTTSLLEEPVHSEHSGRQYLELYITFASIFMKITLMASIWLTVVLALERYLAICRPFLAAKVCTVKRAKLIVIGVFVYSLFSHLSNFFEHSIVTVVDKNTNERHTWAVDTDLSLNETYRTAFLWLVDGALLSIIPFILLLVLNTRLIWEVRKSTAYMQRHLNVASNTAQKEELQVTIMLIVIVIVFFICQAPYVVYSVLSKKFMLTSASLMRLHYVTKLLLTLKSAVNFVIYCWFSEKFWLTLKRIFYPYHCCPCLFSPSASALNHSGYYATMRSYNYTSYTAREATTSL